MIEMQHHVDIERAPQAVLDYVSTPTRWHEWHPYEITITEAPAGPLPIGGRFTYFGGRAGDLSWEVVDLLPGRYWRVRANGRYGLNMLVTYECLATPTGTRFKRTLQYQFSSFVARLLDRLFIRKRIERDSVALLSKLRTVTEAVIPRSYS